MVWWMVALGLAAGQPNASQDAAARPELLAELVACRRIAEINEKVACYDRQVALLDEAERKRDVALVSREDVREARRSLFGLTVPKLRIFGGGGGSEPEFTRITASVASASEAGGRWQFELDDGTRWVQAETEQLARSPRPGDKIRIRKAALGSFFANVGTAPAIRVRRVN